MNTSEASVAAVTDASASYHERARALHARVAVIDGHCDTITYMLDEAHDLAGGSTDHHIDAPRLREAGVRIQVLASWTEPVFTGVTALARILEKIGNFHLDAAHHGHRIVTTKADLDVPSLGYILSLEDAAPLMGSPRLLQIFYKAGVRMIGLTWNGRNEIADGVGVGSKPGGITDIGYAMIDHMNALGIVIDLSHIAEIGFWDVLAASKKPVVCSHSNAKSIHEHRRNLTDEQIRAIALQGGCIGVAFVPSFLCDHRPGVADVMRHVDHLYAIGGPGVVALGSDFDGIDHPPEGLGDVTGLPNLTAAMLEKYDEETVAGFLGGNWLRVFRANWVE